MSRARIHHVSAALSLLIFYVGGGCNEDSSTDPDAANAGSAEAGKSSGKPAVNAGDKAAAGAGIAAKAGAGGHAGGHAGDHAGDNEYSPGAGAGNAGRTAARAGSGSPAAGSGGASGHPTAGVSGAAGGAGTDTPVAPPIGRSPVFDAGSDPNRNLVTAADLCTRLATINCAGESFCCDNPGRTVETCRADLMKTCVEDLVLDRIAMNAVSGFDAAAAERAYTELESKASQCDPSVAAWGASAAGLRGILKGTIAPNTSCKPPQAFPDKAALGAALVSCADPQQYACSFPNVLDAWTCTPKAAAGGVCNSDNNCNDGLFCAISGLSGTGTCNDRYAPGVACKAPTQCTSLFCKGGQCVEANQQAAYCLMN